MQSTTLRGAPVVTAPGKVFLIGEYAVLEDGVAVVAAVNRRATGQYIPDMAPSSALVEHAVRQAADAFGELDGALPPGSVLVDTSTFHDGVHKMGFGSSAAAAVAAVGAVLEYVGRPVAQHRAVVHELADAAHRASQGGVGSGADVAAAVHGGVIRFRRPGNGPFEVAPLTLPPGLQVLVFWSGSPASTPRMIEAVRSVAERNAPLYRWIMEELRGASLRFADALGQGDAAAAIEAAVAFMEPLEELGNASGVPIVTPVFKAAGAAAQDAGGVAKPSGAGGGDVGIALFPDPDAAQAFVQRCPGGVSVLDVRVDGQGVSRRLPGAS